MNRYLYFLQCIVLVIGFSYQSKGQIISTYAGNGSVGFSGDGGNATLASLDSPTALAIDGFGNIYINDQLNNRVRKVTPSGIITTVAGNGSIGYSGDGGPATDASLGRGWGIAVDMAGNIFIADQNNHRVRKVNTAGIITTIAGSGGDGYSGDGGAATAATMKRPIGIAVDGAGNIYVGDADTSCVRKITPFGTITTYAGNSTYGFSGDGGQATAARLSLIFGLAVDATGNLYICDAGNHRVRMVTPDGIIKTIAGNGGIGYSGDGVAATATALNQPLGVYAANNGIVYISDCQNNRLRKIDKYGIISTVAGTGAAGYNGDGMPATAAKLFLPIGVVLDTNENIYVTDMRNVRIRKINNILAFVYGDDEHIAVCENSGANAINTILSVRDIYIGLADAWTLEAPPVHGTAFVSYSAISSGGVATPTGLSYTPTLGYTGQDSFQVKVTNSLSSDIITIYVSVDPLLSPGVITGPNSVCVGETITLENVATGGSWSSASGFISITATDTGCFVKGLTAGVDTIRYQVSNACGTASAYMVITINPLPDPGFISGPVALCLGSTVSFSASISSGSWSTSNLNASVNNIGQVKGIAPGTVTIIYTTSNTYCTAAAIQIVEVEIFPDAGVITGPVEVCIGQQINMEDTVAGGIWSNTNGNATVINGLVTGIVEGSDFINYSVTNSCGTAITTRPLTVRPIPEVPQIDINQGLLSATKGYASYQWKFNATNISGAVYDTFYADAPGVYEVVVSNAFGCSTRSGKIEYRGCGPDDVKIYPNPTRGVIIVEWCKKVSARLLTIDGKEVGISGGVNNMEIRNVPAGMYLLVVYDGNGKRVKTYKIVMLK